MDFLGSRPGGWGEGPHRSTTSQSLSPPESMLSAIVAGCVAPLSRVHGSSSPPRAMRSRRPPLRSHATPPGLATVDQDPVIRSAVFLYVCRRAPPVASVPSVCVKGVPAGKQGCKYDECSKLQSLEPSEGRPHANGQGNRGKVQLSLPRRVDQEHGEGERRAGEGPEP